MVRKAISAMVLTGATVLSGCSTVNPYHDDTMCPARNDFGQCVSMTEAYEHTLSDKERLTPAIPKDKGKTNDADGQADKSAKGTPGDAPATGAEKTYRGELYTELATLIQSPKTPVMKPPTVRRVLVLPYQDDALFMPRYFYMVIDQGTWTLDEVPAQTAGAHSVELFSEHEK